jgi:hypothetical protein
MVKTLPAVHLNGTSKQALIDGYTEAAYAVEKAIASVTEAGPNARDYYVQDPGAFEAARSEHNERIRALRVVFTDLMELAEKVDAGGWHR